MATSDIKKTKKKLKAALRDGIADPGLVRTQIRESANGEAAAAVNWLREVEDGRHFIRDIIWAELFEKLCQQYDNRTLPKAQ